MKHSSKETICEKASIFYYDYIQDTRFCDVDPEILCHIEECAFCQSKIEKLKAVLTEVTSEEANRKDTHISKILASHFNLVNKEITCGIAKRFLSSLTGLSFDVKVLTPITVHIENCSLCKSDLDAIRNLKLTEEQLICLGWTITSQMIEHGEECELCKESIGSFVKNGFDNNTLAVLKHVIEREESGIVTKYITKEWTNVENPKGLSTDCEDWPIEIIVYNRRKEKANKMDLARGLSSSYSCVRQLVKPLAAIAAMIFIAVWLFVGSFAKAIEFNDIYNTIGKIKNICLAGGTSRADETVQKVWISNNLNIKLFYSAHHWIFWDIQNKVRSSWTGELAHLETDNLSEAELVNVRQTMDIPLTLLPFQNPRLLPGKYDWKLLPDKEVTKQFSNIQVYDLLWSNQTTNGSLVYYKWRAYIDKDNLLPKRIENWQKYSSSGEYELKNWMNITYPQTDEIEKLIRENGFIPK